MEATEPAAAGPDAIVVSGLSKVFHDPRRGDVHAVSDVSFTCRGGEVFGLLGPNGAGKSTTLRILATVLAPSAGRAVIGGHDVSREPLAVRRTIGYLSGSTGLYGRLTARETLEYFGRLHGLRGERLRARVEELLAMFGIAEYASARCESLSTGMRQKVSIARTIVHDPPVLIFDEPTAGLDILVASTLLEFIESCRAAGKCILFSTHILSEVERLCDRIGIIYRGKVQAEGTLEDLRRRTGALYVEDVFRRVVLQDDAAPAPPAPTSVEDPK